MKSDTGSFWTDPRMDPGSVCLLSSSSQYKLGLTSRSSPPFIGAGDEVIGPRVIKSIMFSLYSCLVLVSSPRQVQRRPPVNRGPGDPPFRLVQALLPVSCRPCSVVSPVSTRWRERAVTKCTKPQIKNTVQRVQSNSKWNSKT